MLIRVYFSRTFYYLDIAKPTKQETSVPFNRRLSVANSDLPVDPPPIFLHTHNEKLNNGGYAFLHARHRGDVYVYDFKATTGARSATQDNLEIQNIFQPICTKEEDIIPKLPSHTSYPKFSIDQIGLGDSDHKRALQQACREACLETASACREACLETARKILPTVTEQVLREIVGYSNEDQDEEIPIHVDVVHITLHETSLNKMLCCKIGNFYPHLTVLAEVVGDAGHKWSRYALSREDVAIYGSANVCNVVCVESDTFVENLDAKAWEGKMTSNDASAPKTRWQLLANMTKSGSIVAIKALQSGIFFQKITV